MLRYCEKCHHVKLWFQMWGKYMYRHTHDLLWFERSNTCKACVRAVGERAAYKAVQQYTKELL